MTDETVTRRLFPGIISIRSTPHVAKDRKVLVYTPELIKAVTARMVYRKGNPTLICKELGFNDLGQVLRAVALGRKLLVAERWATVKPQLVYEMVHDSAPVPAAPNPPPKPIEQRFRWPLSLIKWALAQHELNGFSPLSIYNALLAVKYENMPTKTSVTQWAGRKLKNLEDLKIEQADCLLYPYPVEAAKKGRKAKPVGQRVKYGGRAKGQASMKAKAWARDKILDLVAQHDIKLDELGD